MICLDTHALLWWALDPKRLSRRAKDLCAKMEREGGCASAISVWELEVKVLRKKLELPLSIEELVKRIRETNAVDLVPVTTEIWIQSARLPWAHRDPADRVIYATAVSRGTPLLTADEVLREIDPVRCVW